jgi:hypothetical protein
VSSAYKKIVIPLIDSLAISFIYRKKRSGPRIDPWSTPDFYSAHLDEKLFMELIYIKIYSLVSFRKV